MQNLTRAHTELYRRNNDRKFRSLQDMLKHTMNQKQDSKNQEVKAKEIQPYLRNFDLALKFGEESYAMNDWSFTQACSLARVSKDTINKLNHRTARQVLEETLPNGDYQLQALTQGNMLRAINGPRYQRLYNADLVSMAIEFATDFQPPQSGMNGASGLYCGEQDMFIFLIDPTGFIEIEGEAFAPGFFLWNSEVGRRTVGIQTFWFQAVCQNHIVWDAMDVTEFSRKHIGDVTSAFADIQRIIESLVKRRDERKDAFVNVIRKAMKEKIGSADEDALNLLLKHGFKQELAKEALLIARQQGRLTVFSIVDALTRLAGENCKNAGDRLELDVRAAGLLELVAA